MSVPQDPVLPIGFGRRRRVLYQPGQDGGRLLGVPIGRNLSSLGGHYHLVLVTLAHRRKLCAFFERRHLQDEQRLTD
jgi:hypothetical protein